MQKCKKILLSTAYLPNIQYFSKLLYFDNVYIEVYENYQKQSYRNRTCIYGANGLQELVIPVKRPNGNNTNIQDVLIDYDMPWNQTHWKALVSAYKHSPFFEFFEEELEALYNRKFKYLLEWNFCLLDSLFVMIDRNINYKKTTSFIPEPDPSYCDYRFTIHPKKRMQKPDPFFTANPYFQVFADKHGFKENLSFLDLIFNEGPQAAFLCKNTVKTVNSY
jgi:hypothetical protein